MADTKKEPLWFFLTGHWYTGNFPNFYDVSTLPSTKILEENYEAIKKEIVDFYQREGSEMKPNFSPYKYKEEGWRTMDVMSFGLKYKDHIQKFPVTWGIVSKIPNVVTMQIAALHPHKRVRAHFGDSNAIVRSHMGIVVPGKYPDLGFRNGSYEQCWEEGKVLAICIAHRHYVWNETDKVRIILLVDTIHPDYANRKLYVCSSLLAAAALKVIVTKMPWTKKTPDFIVLILHKFATLGVMSIIALQNLLSFSIGDFFAKYKMKVEL